MNSNGGCVYRQYYFGAVSVPDCGGTKFGPGYCHVLQAANATTYSSSRWSAAWLTTGNSCPVNSTQVTGGCQCNAPLWVENTAKTACVQAPSELEQVCDGRKAGYPMEYTVAGRGVSTLCMAEPLYNSAGAGCAIALTGVVSVQIEGQWSTVGTGTYTGKTCQGNAPTPPVTVDPPLSPASAPAGATNPCPNGQPGTVNGVSVCLPYPSNATVENTEGQTKEITNPDGSKVKTQSSQVTICTAGACNTTTTTTTTNTSSSGTVTGTATTSSTASQPKGQFCAENPGNKQCSDGEDSSFGGSCSGGFQCKGDAVQCAVAREIHTQNCKLNDSSSAENALYHANKTRTGDQTGDLPGSSTVNLGPGGFDTTDALGAPSSVGIADLNVQVWGRDLVLPFSNLNPYLVILGNVLLAVTAVLCARIVMRG